MVLLDGAEGLLARCHRLDRTMRSNDKCRAVREPEWKGLRSKLATGDVSSIELTRDALTRISDLNPELNAVISSSEERAINAAKKADEARRQGETQGKSRRRSPGAG